MWLRMQGPLSIVSIPGLNWLNHCHEQFGRDHGQVEGVENIAADVVAQKRKRIRRKRMISVSLGVVRMS